MFVDYNYADTYGLKLMAGRFFSEEFQSDSTEAIVVNLAAVKTFGWGTPENAIGKKFGEDPHYRYVIGVVNNFNFETLRRNVEPLRILPVGTPAEVSIKAEFSNPAALISGIEKVWNKYLPGQAMNPAFMDTDLQNQYTTELRFKTIFGIFAVISIIIASIGLFGLATFSVQQQIKEIGIRKVLGASSVGILKMINKQFLIYVVLALLFAFPLTLFLMGEWLNGFAYKISLGISDFLIGAGIALIVAAVTISYHTLRAATTNPVNTLKDE
jgi:putative ABC transport system permease protein